MKYVCVIEYFPNCPSCDYGYYSRLDFHKSLEDILTWLLQTNPNEYQIKDIYNMSGKLTDLMINYELGRHSVIGINVDFKGLKLKRIDNGSGELIWNKEI